MQRLNLDNTDQAVKKFVQSLKVKPEGIELELNGRLLCRVVPALEMSAADKKALVEERWQLVRQAQERNKDVPARVIEKEVRQAVAAVRRRGR